MARAYLVVEGQGDEAAALNLVHRLSLELGLHDLRWAPPLRGKNLHQERGIQKVGELVRSKRDAAALLILRDEDDGCPKTFAPREAAWLRRLNLPFPSAVVLAHREFESFFLPCIARIAGKALVGPKGIERDGIRANTVFSGDPQSVRGVKEWLSKHMPPGQSYKPTLDQLAMARLVDFQLIRSSQPPLPCFGSFERAIRFLHQQVRDQTNAVYPVVPLPSSTDPR